MIAFIEGQISYKNPTYVVLDTGGVGYMLHISLQTYSRIESKDRVRLWTHLHIKEDGHSLYGFWDDDERTLFRQLISVSGIGPNTAQLILSAMRTEEIRMSIVAEDVQTFQRVKGIGAKTAQRLIIDLKDKVSKDTGEIVLTKSGEGNRVRDEALSALISLGFPRPLVTKAINKVLSRQEEVVSVEELIKSVLKEVS